VDVHSKWGKHHTRHVSVAIGAWDVKTLRQHEPHLPQSEIGGFLQYNGDRAVVLQSAEFSFTIDKKLNALFHGLPDELVDLEG
jgi:hypothetical protein